MLRRIPVFGLLACFTAVYLSLVTAQVPATPGAANRNPQVVPRPPVSAWKRDDIRLLTRRLIAGGGTDKKGEFETTEHFESRMASLLKNNSQKLVFVKPSEDLVRWVDPGEDITYDADTRQFTAHLRAQPASLYEDASISTDSVTIRSILLSSWDYIGKNSFGVSKRIHSSVWEDYGVAFSNDSAVEFSGVWDFLGPIDPRDAKLLKPFLSIALVGTLAEAHVHIESKHSEPTISSPYERLTNSFHVLMTLQEIQVIDTRTGRVVASAKGK